jgi:hypothetical protein
LIDTMINLGWPKSDIRFWNIGLQQPEHTRCVGDIADIECLPARTEQDSRWSAYGDCLHC